MAKNHGAKEQKRAAKQKARHWRSVLYSLNAHRRTHRSAFKTPQNGRSSVPFWGARSGTRASVTH